MTPNPYRPDVRFNGFQSDHIEVEAAVAVPWVSEPMFHRKAVHINIFMLIILIPLFA
jgi:hypothetical protein